MRKFSLNQLNRRTCDEALNDETPKYLINGSKGGFRLTKPFVLGISGSPRKNGNTDIVVKKALEVISEEK